MPVVERSFLDDLRAVPLIVMIFLVLDAVTTLIGQSYGMSGLGPSGLLPALQMLLVVAATAAAMWARPAVAIALTAAVAALVVTVGPGGQEDWLLVVTGVTAAIRANRWQLGLVVFGQLAYAVGFGLNAERRHPGWGWSTALGTVGLAAAAVIVGLVARRFFVARNRQRRRVQELERERSEIRAIERTRLADELQTVVTQGLAGIETELDAVARRPPELDNLRQGLDRIDLHSRSLLTELRTLLDALRRDPAPGVGAEPAPAGARSGSYTARQLRIAAAAVFGVLAVRLAVVNLDAFTAGVLIQVIALLACSVAVWRPAVGASCAAVALVISRMLDPSGNWDVLPVVLISVIAALALGWRRSWLVAGSIAAYALLIAVTDRSDPVGHVVLVGYVGFGAIAVGLAARHFVDARLHSLRRIDDLATEREQVASEERTAVARELHDVVAHQLSVTTMLIMATSRSSQPEVLTNTLEKVRRTTEAAQHELSVLLHAMRAPEPDQRPSTVLTPVVTAQALARRLTENGHQPVLDIDPAANTLDPTTQRTLVRIMQEGATNILRYAPAGSTCHFRLAVDESGVSLSIVSPLAPTDRRSDLSLGWGLRGLRERVDLTHGTFQAGADQGRWVLSATLPAPADGLGRDLSPSEPGRAGHTSPV